VTGPAPERRLVVAAVIRRADGRYLVARRPPGRPMAGLWEFPGGAVEDGESAEAALARELREELGLAVTVGDPLTFAWHRDARREVLLLFYRAELGPREPHGREGQEVRWVTAAELAALPTPPADAELISRLQRDAR
jgi:8-oxo-dGTP diphosphatase